MSFKFEAQNLTQNFGSFKALDQVSIDLKPGRIHAILGENGAGKSTLIKILSGVIKPTEGTLLLKEEEIKFASPLEAQRFGIGVIHQHFTLIDELSVLDNIILGAEPSQYGFINRLKALERVKIISKSSPFQLDWEKKVSELSVGEKQKLEILRCIFYRSKVILLDEPTAVLTPQEVESFFMFLKQLRDQGIILAIVTHKLNEVMSLCDDYTVLRAGKLMGTGFVKDTSAEKLAELMVGTKVDHVLVTPEKEKSNKLKLIVQSLSTPRNERSYIDRISFEVREHEILGVAGVEGSGQSSLVQCLLGLKNYQGQIFCDGLNLESLSTFQRRKLMGYIPQDRTSDGLWLNESCYTNMIIGLEDQFSKLAFISKKRIRDYGNGWSQALDIKAPHLNTEAKNLSGGNQQKLIVAREMFGREPALLICHQPTRGVDVLAAQKIYKEILELKKIGSGILLISSDLDELLQISDRMVVLLEGKINGEFNRPEFDIKKIGQAMTQLQNHKEKSP